MNKEYYKELIMIYITNHLPLFSIKLMSIGLPYAIAPYLEIEIPIKGLVVAFIIIILLELIEFIEFIR